MSVIFSQAQFPGLSLLSARSYHPAMKHVGPIRLERCCWGVWGLAPLGEVEKWHAEIFPHPNQTQNHNSSCTIGVQELGIRTVGSQRTGRDERLTLKPLMIVQPQTAVGPLQ